MPWIIWITAEVSMIVRKGSWERKVSQMLEYDVKNLLPTTDCVEDRICSPIEGVKPDLVGRRDWIYASVVLRVHHRPVYAAVEIRYQRGVDARAC